MKRFHFRLDRVLRFRETERKERGRVLAEKNEVQQLAESKLNGILEAQERCSIEEGELYSMAHLNLNGNYRALLQDALVNQRLLVFEATCAVEEARDAYIEKAIESEILNTLKERRLREHVDAARLEEQKEVDEIAVQRHRFKKGTTPPRTEDDNNG